MASTQFHALSSVLHGEHIVHILLAGHTDVGFAVNVVRTDIDGSGLRKGKIEFELSYAQA